MMRAYGHHDCQFCGKFPPHGYVYVCCQDEDQAERRNPPEHFVRLSEYVTTGSFEAKAYMAEALQMSVSVVKQMREGFYTSEQIETLFSQRRHVIDVIREATQGGQSDAGDIGKVQQQSAESTAAGSQSEGAPAQTSVTIKTPPCNLQVCHNCKPFLRDRIFAQPATTLEKKSHYWNAQDIAWLPIHNANILARLVLPGEERPLPENTPISISSSEYSDSSSDAYSFRFPGATPEKGEHNQAFDNRKLRDVTNISRWEDVVDSANQSTPFRTRTQTHFTPGLTESPMSNATNSPAGHATTPLTPLRHDEEAFEASFEKKVGTFAKSASFCGPFRPRQPSKERPLSSNNLWNKDGCRDDDHIRGGVALTEEAIETGVPDIITT